MIEISDLPTVNATLNGIACCFLVAGYCFVKQGRTQSHKRCMIAAFSISILFLISYLTYRFAGAEKKFGGQGWIRPVYFFILITHIVLAASVPILATRTLYLGLKGRWDAHKKWARWTFPIWVYVSITGVLVYLLLFVIFGPAKP